MKKVLNILVGFVFIFLASCLAVISFNSTIAKADTQILGLSDFNVDSKAIVTGMTTAGTCSSETLGKKIEFNLQKASEKGRIHIVTYAYNENFWYGFHIFVSQNDKSTEGLLKFDAYADKVVNGVVTPLEYFFGRHESSTVKTGDNFKLSTLLTSEGNGNGYEFTVFINDVAVLSSKTPYEVKDGVDDLSVIAHGDKFLVYTEGTFIKIWDTNTNEPQTAENWLDDSVSISKDRTLYNNNKSKINIYDIEQVASDAASINLGFGTKKTEEGNIELLREKGDSRPAIITITPKNSADYTGNYAIKYRTVNNVVISNEESAIEMDSVLKKEVHIDGRIEIALEINAQVGGSFISNLSSNIIYLRLDFTDNKSYIAEFFPNGTSGGGSVAIDFSLPQGYSSMLEFLPCGSEYTVEYGQFFYNGEESKEKLVNYILITNSNGDSIYGHAEYGGSFIASHARNGGKLKFVNPPYICASKIELLSIDKTTFVMANYFPAYEESGIMKNRDIGEILPIGQEGITYTTKSVTNRRSILNIEKISNDSRYDMYLKLDGDYCLRIAFFTDRANGKNATSGYHVVFTPQSISLQSFFSESVREEKIIDNPIQAGVKTHVEIRVAELYVMGVPEGQRVTVFVNGTQVVTMDFARQSETVYRGFDGIMSGNGTVTIYPYSAEITKTNGLAIDVKSNSIDIDKRVKLDYSCEKSTLTDKVSYEIKKGSSYAELTYNDKNETWYIKGSKNGKVKIVAKIENEYGEFVSKEFEIIVGTGYSSKGGCKSKNGISILGVTLIVALAEVVLNKNKNRG